MRRASRSNPNHKCVHSLYCVLCIPRPLTLFFDLAASVEPLSTLPSPTLTPMARKILSFLIMKSTLARSSLGWTHAQQVPDFASKCNVRLWFPSTAVHLQYGMYLYHAHAFRSCLQSTRMPTMWLTRPSKPLPVVSLSRRNDESPDR